MESARKPIRKQRVIFCISRSAFCKTLYKEERMARRGSIASIVSSSRHLESIQSAVFSDALVIMLISNYGNVLVIHPTIVYQNKHNKRWITSSKKQDHYHSLPV